MDRICGERREKHNVQYYSYNIMPMLCHRQDEEILLEKLLML